MNSAWHLYLLYMYIIFANLDFQPALDLLKKQCCRGAGKLVNPWYAMMHVYVYLCNGMQCHYKSLHIIC